jgi:ribosomal protein L37E
MKQATGRERSGPRRLPTLHIGGKTYYIDLRLRQFRTAAPPHELIDFIEFESRRGRRLLDECVVLECQRCGRRALVARKLNYAECLQCGSPLTSARSPLVP